MTSWSSQLAGLYLAAAPNGLCSPDLGDDLDQATDLGPGRSTYVLTATLFVVLFGIGLGSLLFHVFRGVASRPALPVVVVGILLLSTLAGKLCLPALAIWVSPTAVQQWRANPSGNALLHRHDCRPGIRPGLSHGHSVPLFVHLTHASAKQVGRREYLCLEHAGLDVGANLTAVLLFPLIGTAGCMALAAGLYLVALLAMISWRGWQQLATGEAIAAGRGRHAAAGPAARSSAHEYGLLSLRGPAAGRQRLPT